MRAVRLGRPHPWRSPWRSARRPWHATRALDAHRLELRPQQLLAGRGGPGGRGSRCSSRASSPACTGPRASLKQTGPVDPVIPPLVSATEGYNHVGDIGYQGGRVLLPLECYTPGGPNGGTPAARAQSGWPTPPRSRSSTTSSSTRRRSRRPCGSRPRPTGSCSGPRAEPIYWRTTHRVSARRMRRRADTRSWYAMRSAPLEVQSSCVGRGLDPHCRWFFNGSGYGGQLVHQGRSNRRNRRSRRESSQDIYCRSEGYTILGSGRGLD